MNRQTGEKVGEFASPTVKPEDLAAVAVALCWLFKDEHGNPAMLIWEHDGPGMLFGKTVIDLGFRNIYYRQAHMTLAGGKVSDIPGWYPSPREKLRVLQDYRTALDSRHCINHSAEALGECLHFRYLPDGNVEHSGEASRNDPTGARGNHGDRVIADALTWKLCMDRAGQRSDKPKEPSATGSLAWRRLLVDNAASPEGWQ